MTALRSVANALQGNPPVRVDCKAMEQSLLRGGVPSIPPQTSLVVIGEHVRKGPETREGILTRVAHSDADSL
eukprot:3080476-Amphidinium_carterae.1